MHKCKIIAITNQKGGVGKTVTSACLGVCLADIGNRVLIVDFDPQGNLTKGLGYRDPKRYKLCLKDALLNEINDVDIHKEDYIIHMDENFFNWLISLTYYSVKLIICLEGVL